MKADFYFLVNFLAAFVVVLRVSGSQSDTPKLRHYNVKEELVSVSGLSSGAYFAVQFHVAFSSSVMGMGAVAGGPYWCANGDALVAITSCTVKPEQIYVAELVTMTCITASTQTIDSPVNMKKDRVFIFSGTKDTVVLQGVGRKLEEYYSHFTSEIATEFSIPSQHAIVTDDYGSSCGLLQSPFINNCNYSTAYHMLQHIYADIKMATSDDAKDENLMEFDQREFFSDGLAASMDTLGYIYVPTNCQNGSQQCRLHVAFHGCLQGRTSVSTAFVKHAGYNGVAEMNDIIILYPQVVISSLVPFNPQGCWDWWGYTGAPYASKLGVQMARVKLMVERIIA